MPLCLGSAPASHVIPHVGPAFRDILIPAMLVSYPVSYQSRPVSYPVSYHRSATAPTIPVLAMPRSLYDAFLTHSRAQVMRCYGLEAEIVLKARSTPHSHL